MPVPPFAQVQVSVNGGANVSGAIQCAFTNTAQPSATNTTGWTAARWEIYDFPPGFTVPSGWSTDASGIYFFQPTNPTTLPPVITLPASGTQNWGPFMLRLRINGNPLARNADGSPNNAFVSQLTDETTILWIPSPVGALQGLGFNETTQRDLIRGFVGPIMASLRLIDPLLGGGSAVTWANDLVGSSSTHQWVVSLTGAAGAGASVALGAVATFGLAFAAAVTTPTISHTVVAGTGATAGVALSITAQAGQQQTGVNANNNGGNLALGGGPAGTGGSGAAGIAGNASLYTGATERWRVTANGGGAVPALVSVQSDPIQFGTGNMPISNPSSNPANTGHGFLQWSALSAYTPLLTIRDSGTLTLPIVSCNTTAYSLIIGDGQFSPGTCWTATSVSGGSVNLSYSTAINFYGGSGVQKGAFTSTGFSIGVPLQGYAGGNFPFQMQSISVASAAATTLSAAQYSCPIIYITGNTTGTITTPSQANAIWCFVNQGTGVQTLKCGTGATTITVAANKSQWCSNDGANAMIPIGGNF